MDQVDRDRIAENILKRKLKSEGYAMEHSISGKAETVIGCDLELRELYVKYGAGQRTIELTDSQVAAIREYWKRVAMTPSGFMVEHSVSSEAEKIIILIDLETREIRYAPRFAYGSGERVEKLTDFEIQQLRLAWRWIQNGPISFVDRS